MAIGLVQHRKAITSAAIAKFKDDKSPLMGLSSFFKKITTRALLVSIEVRRMRQLVAVDVQRGKDPNRITFNKSTERLYEPPLYSQMFDFTKLQGYDVTFGAGVAPNGEFADMLINAVVDETQAAKNMILRAIEQQHASVLQYGIVTLKNGDSIDYKRKAGSMVTLTSTAAWSATGTADPEVDLKAGIDFLREKGLSSGTTVNALFGQAAFAYFKSNTKILAQAAIFNQIRRIDLGMPQFDNKTGLVFQGQIAAGDYLVNIWTYVDFYENADGTTTKYIDPLNVVMIPDDFEGVDSYGGVPAVFDLNTDSQRIAPIEGEFVIHDEIDQRKKTWDIVVESAPLVVPVSIDRLYTIKVAAA